MNAVIVGVGDSIHLPHWVADLASFRRWFRSGDFPERGRIAYLAGEVVVDLSMEIILHNKVKLAFTIALGGLVEQIGRGHFLPDGMRLTNVPADLSAEPDALFVSEDALDEGRVLLTDGLESLEVEGTPDMVLEVVSASSVEKDTVVLRELYWKADIPEYWLVDPRGEELSFDILRAEPRGYLTTRKQGGWMKSVVFGKSFRLTQKDDARGLPRFKLEMR